MLTERKQHPCRSPTNLYVPYRLSIPTSIGSAVMTADRIDITAANKSVIALTQ